jgi:cell division septation protein DedD
MAQDFARHRDKPPPRSGRPRAATRTPPPAASHWNWYIAGVLSGLFAAFIGYIGIANLGGKAVGEAAAQQVVVAEEDLPTFSFYRELANASIDVNDDPAPGIAPAAQKQAAEQGAAAAAQQPATTASATAPATTATTVASDNREYLLQAGSFQDRQDAEARRAKIILLNLNVTVVPGVVAGRTWQRVQVGPFMGRQSTEAARALLSENNIDSIPLIVR